MSCFHPLSPHILFHSSHYINLQFYRKPCTHGMSTKVLMKRQDREEPWNCRSSAVAVGPLKLTTKAVTWPKIQGGSGILGPFLNIFLSVGIDMQGTGKHWGGDWAWVLPLKSPFGGDRPCPSACQKHAR